MGDPLLRKEFILIHIDAKLLRKTGWTVIGLGEAALYMAVSMSVSEGFLAEVLTRFGGGD